MPLPAQALLDARDTATRLIKLLPAQATAPLNAGRTTDHPPKLVGWTPVYIALSVLVIAVGIAQFWQSGSDADVAPPAQKADPFSVSAPQGR